MKVKKTSLNNLHQKFGAKLVEFAGYEMPIQYKDGIVQEHKFTRSNSGIFDVSHMGQLFIFGSDKLTFDLEKIFPVNLKNLNLNQSKYSFLMNDNGGIQDDLIITKTKEGYLIILNAACKYNDYEIIKSSIIPPSLFNKKEYFEWLTFKFFKSAGIIFSKDSINVSSPSKKNCPICDTSKNPACVLVEICSLTIPSLY